jgi:hypothetical protein
MSIFLSQPCEEIYQQSLKAVSDHPSINLYKSETNIGFAAINAFLQIIKPEKFVIFEEDHILPQSTKYLMPYWPWQFGHRLDHFDIVGFQTTMDNLCYDFYRTNLWSEPKIYDRHPLNFQWLYNIKQQVIGSGMAFKSSFYKSTAENKPPYYLSGDGLLITKANTVCLSSVRGYHIGWNQEMDGFKKIGDSTRFPNPEIFQTILDVKRNISHTIDLSKFKDI